MPTADHTLKVVPPYFEALLDGTKTFEIRANDRAFQKGDRLVLWEFNARGETVPCTDYPCSLHRPRAVTATVGFVYSGDPRYRMKDALAPGYVVLSLLAVKAVA